LIRKIWLLEKCCLAPINHLVLHANAILLQIVVTVVTLALLEIHGTILSLWTSINMRKAASDAPGLKHEYILTKIPSGVLVSAGLFEDPSC
jgi:hypothetical protein